MSTLVIAYLGVEIPHIRLPLTMYCIASTYFRESKERSCLVWMLCTVSTYSATNSRAFAKTRFLASSTSILCSFINIQTLLTMSFLSWSATNLHSLSHDCTSLVKDAANHTGRVSRIHSAVSLAGISSAMPKVASAVRKLLQSQRIAQLGKPISLTMSHSRPLCTQDSRRVPQSPFDPALH